MLMQNNVRPPVKKRVHDLSGFSCPKCHNNFLVFSFKKLVSKGYSCQSCGYTFMVSEADLLMAGRERKNLVDGEARKVLARKGY